VTCRICRSVCRLPFVLAVFGAWGILASLLKTPDFFLLRYVSFTGVLWYPKRRSCFLLWARGFRLVLRLGVQAASADLLVPAFGPEEGLTVLLQGQCITLCCLTAPA